MQKPGKGKRNDRDRILLPKNKDALRRGCQAHDAVETQYSIYYGVEQSEGVFCPS